MSISFVLGYVAATIGSVMAMSPLLQARTIIRSGSSQDVSIAAMWIFVVNSFGWLSYGVSMGSLPMVVPNVIALLSLTCAITVARRYHRPENVASVAGLSAPVSELLPATVRRPSRVAAEAS